MFKADCARAVAAGSGEAGAELVFLPIAFLPLEQPRKLAAQHPHDDRVLISEALADDSLLNEADATAEPLRPFVPERDRHLRALHVQLLEWICKKRMYHAAQKRLDSTDAAQPDPFAAPQAQADARDAALLDFIESHAEGVIRLDAVPNYLYWGKHWEHKTARAAIAAAKGE